MKILLVLVFLAVAVIACGGSGESDDDKLLHLKNQNLTGENYRLQIRVVAAQNPTQFAATCQQFKGLSAKEVAATLQAATSGSESNIFPNATPVPGQEARPEDNETVAGILLDECNRVTR